jgi:hypothetical protein
VDPRESLRRRVAIQVEGAPRPGGALAPGSTDLSSGIAASDTGQVTWDATQAGRGVVWVDTPRTKLVFGFAGGRGIELSGVRIEVGRQLATALDGFAVVGVTAMDGAPIDASHRLLLTAVGGGLNTGAQLSRYAGETLSFPPPMGALLTLGDRWGTAPSRVEGVPVTVTLPGPAGGAQAWALDERGARRQPVRVRADGGRATVDVGGEYRAVWYEIAR